MTSFDKVSALMGLKRSCISKINTLNLTWKDVEENLDSSEKAFEEAIIELQVREDGLDSIRKSIEERKEEVELFNKLVESRREEHGRKEAEFSLFQQERMEYLRAREEQMETRYSEIKRLVEERIDDADLKEKLLESNVTLMFNKLEYVQEAMKSRSIEIDDKQENLQMQIDKQHKGRWDELLQREKQAEDLMEIYKKRLEDLNLKKRVLHDRFKRLDELQKLNEETREENKMKCKELDSKIKHIDSVEASFNQSLKEFHLKEKQFKLDKEKLDLHMKELGLKQEELEEKLKEIDKTRESVEHHVKEVEMEVERNHLHEQRRDLELKEQQLTSHVTVEKVKEKEMPSISGSAANIQSQFEHLSKQNEIEKQDDTNYVVVVENEVKCDPLVDTRTSIVTHFLANMDLRCLLQFLSKHSTELGLMEKNVSKVLQMSSDSVIIAIMKEFHGQNIPSSTMRSYIFVLEILAGQNIPIEIIKSPVVLETAMKVALEWKGNIPLKKDDPLYILGFLQLVCTYKLTAEFDPDELYKLFCSVANDCGGHVPELSEILFLSELIPVSKILNLLQDDFGQSKKAPWDSLQHRCVPELFILSPDPGKLLLDAMQCCFDSNTKDVKGAKSTMEVFLPLLKELVNEDIEIDIHNSIQAEAFNLASDWKPKLLFPNSPEAVCFLLFLSIYKLGSWFDHEELLHILKDCKTDFSNYLLREFGLEQRMLEFIQKLIAKEKEKQLRAIICIYEFDLADKFPPVPLLKSYLTELANLDNSTTAEEELIALQTVIKCIVTRGLQFLFPVKPLMDRVSKLLQKKTGEKKRPASLPDSNSEAHRVKKVCSDVSTHVNPSIPLSSVDDPNHFEPPGAETMCYRLNTNYIIRKYQRKHK
ncbi:uncharacterized protein LOC124934803 [Impatiens glandulifera]|uniref:uncharacterized protein LOC124934803 n=1 Tax=Impatiens glandulifera TaxID=253017 RepID=UPI001FB1596E|nr:uncharacterized protein LOC124934803 [Impatiens glandulifera]